MLVDEIADEIADWLDDGIADMIADEIADWLRATEGRNPVLIQRASAARN